MGRGVVGVSGRSESDVSGRGWFGRDGRGVSGRGRSTRGVSELLEPLFELEPPLLEPLRPDPPRDPSLLSGREAPGRRRLSDTPSCAAATTGATAGTTKDATATATINDRFILVSLRTPLSGGLSARSRR
ncbi:hypothetical protein GCM10009101_00430 [Brevundimonas lenta]